MLATAESVALVGAKGSLVQVELYVADQGLPGLKVVGLPAASVREADQRVRSAIEASKLKWPQRRMLANLAPAGIRKEGPHFDLAIAIGVLVGYEGKNPERLDGWVFMGELALDGKIRAVRGVLSAALASKAAGRKGIICPVGNANEAAIVDGIEVVPVEDLLQCKRFIDGTWTPGPIDPLPPVIRDYEDMSEVRGQQEALTAVEIAAAGGHNLLMVGPPGSGKSMIASRIPSILPKMSKDESLEVTSIFSIAGVLGTKASIMAQRPFRAPHQGVSLAGLIGGGMGLPRPGEICLAHHGVLFLDEISLFRRDVLDSLRGPLEDGVVRIARVAGSFTYPCQFSLVAAMNPCPCGYRGDERRECTCSEMRYRAYAEKLSGPLIDRFDIQTVMTRPTRVELMSTELGRSSREIRARVEAARAVQTERYGSSKWTNATCRKAALEKTVNLTPSARNVLGEFIDMLGLTGRGVDRVKRLARTIADLEGAAEVNHDHVGSAMNVRFLDSRSLAA